MLVVELEVLLKVLVIVKLLVCKAVFLLRLSVFIMLLFFIWDKLIVLLEVIVFKKVKLLARMFKDLLVGVMLEFVEELFFVVG